MLRLSLCVCYLLVALAFKHTPTTGGGVLVVWCVVGVCLKASAATTVGALSQTSRIVEPMDVCITSMVEPYNSLAG